MSGAGGRDPLHRRAVRFFHESNTSGPILLALVVGAGGGLGAVAFRWLIANIGDVFFGTEPWLKPHLGRYWVVLLPAAGGLVVGLLVHYLAREAKGHGVPEVMEAVAVHGGRIRPRVAVVKSLASSVCIGSGGSAGREGPIVQIGSALGSTLAQVLRLPAPRTRLLVACGAAAGISATFNAPIAGVLFALEVILREFSARYFGLVVLASVAAAAASQRVLGDYPAFRSPEYALESAWELPLYFGLGIVAAVVATGFVRGLYAVEDLTDAWRFPPYLKPAVGGLVVGLIGAWYPHVFGVGYPTIDVALAEKMALTTAAILVVGKLAATSLSIGSGGSGGIFAPSLFMGAMAGSAFGQLVHLWFPEITAHSGAYALVGMAAVFAGAAHAPITSIIILFEMTRDYHIILPLMIAVVVSTLISQQFSRESIYTLKLIRRGVDLARVALRAPLAGVRVADAMVTEVAPVPLSMPVQDLIERLDPAIHHGLPVVDDANRLVGIVSLTDVAEAAAEAEPGQVVEDIATRDPVTCHPDEPLSEALRRMAARDVAQLPVVDRLDARRLVGMLRRPEIIREYGRAVAEQSALSARLDRMRMEMPGSRFIELSLEEESPAVGKRLSELRLPRECILVSVERDGRTLFPHGGTELAAGDRVVAFVGAGAEREACAAMSGGERASRGS